MQYYAGIVGWRVPGESKYELVLSIEVFNNMNQAVGMTRGGFVCSTLRVRSLTRHPRLIWAIKYLGIRNKAPMVIWAGVVPKAKDAGDDTEGAGESYHL